MSHDPEPPLSAEDAEAFAMDLAAFKVTMPVILGSGSGTTTISVHMLDRLYRSYLAAAALPVGDDTPSLDAAWVLRLGEDGRYHCGGCDGHDS